MTAPTAPSPRVVVAAVAGMVAAWLGAGSIGLLAHPLRHALLWLAMAVFLVAAWPQGRRARKEWGILAAALLAGLILTVPATGAYNVLGVAAMLAVLARMHAGLDHRALLIAAFAVAVFAVFRLACTTIATVWLAADWLGQALGTVASAISGKPLWVGATFGGVDFLVLMIAFYGAWLRWTAPPRWPRAVYALAAAGVGQLGYLALLAYSIDLASALPVHQPPEPQIYVPPPWFAGDAVRTLLPWNVPALAGLIQAAIAACMFRWAKWKAESGKPKAESRKPKAESASTARSVRFPLSAFRFSLAALIPVVTTLSPVRCDLSGRRIVAYDHGDRAPSEGWSWDKPVHDKYGRASAGLYGMFPTLVRCLGGKFARSADLSDQDLAGADVLVVIHPLGPWPEDRLKRVWDFVRGGGSLLVVAEPRVWEQGRTSSFDELLKLTSMAVRFDAAIAETGMWQHALHVLAHPTTALLGDDHGRLGLAECSSIETRWPARPLVIGRWGWSDPGSDAVLTGQYRLDPGERLGDLVLAAEERIGSGTVIVIGDTTAFKNEGLSSGYQFVGRLLGYLAGHGAGTQAGWRQALGLLGCFLLAALLAWRPNPATLAWASLLLALSFGSSTVLTAQGSKVVPDGRVTSPKPNCLACIDASHLEAYGGYPWLESGLQGVNPEDVPEDDPRVGTLRRDTGIGGLELNLMRNGYLPIRVSELTGEQLQRAGLFVSIAPARAYSGGQQKALKAFLDRGGIWVCMVGADLAGPINGTLAAFGLSVPPAHLRMGEKGIEPLATAHVPSPYAHVGNYDARLWFDSAWPVDCHNDNPEVLAGGIDKSPVVVSVDVGVRKGRIVLIGDSLFAANRNLENDAGPVLEGVRENAAFWRWLIARVRDGQDWSPPDIPLPKAQAEDDEEGMDVRPGEVPAARAPAAKSPAAKGPADKGPAAPKAPRARPKATPGKEARP